MNERALQPGERLHWMRPSAMDRNQFASVRERLAQIMSVAQSNEVYTANRRSIFLVEDENLGRIAVKEMRHESALRRFWFRYVRYGDAVREFRAGSEFQARGGRTPAFLGAALDCNPFSLKRVLLFIRWLEGAETLTDYLARLGGRAPPDGLERLAQTLVESARLGLVHGRHSSENILVDAGGDRPDFYTIDFAYAQLLDAFDAAGFVRDVSRIAHWLWHEQVCDPAEIARFFGAVADCAWPDSDDRVSRLSQMNAELERWQLILEKSAL